MSVESYARQIVENWVESITDILTQLPNGTRLYFLRHGQTDLNLKGIVQGGSMWRQQLNDVGQKQAEQTAAELCVMKFDKVFSSPARRAFVTASIVAGYEEIKTIEALNEVYWGDIDGKEQGIVYHAIQRSWFEDHKLHSWYNKGESAYELLCRMVTSISTIVRESNEDHAKNILIAGHGFWIGLFLTTLYNGKLGLELKPKNGKYIIVEIKDDKVNIVLDSVNNF